MTAQFTYGGRDRLPGQSPAVETFENEFVFGPWPAQYISGLTIDGSTRDTGNTNHTHILRAGILLGQNFSTTKLHVWNPAANDGTEYIWGILKESRSMLSNNTDQDRLTGPIMISGGLLSSRLIIPGNTNVGIVGDANEYLIRELLRANFVLNDSYMMSRPAYSIYTYSAAEASSGITLEQKDSHKAFRDGAGAITITLPANPYKGLSYRAMSIAGNAITMASGSSNILVPGSAAAASTVVTNDVKTLTGDGTYWVVT